MNELYHHGIKGQVWGVRNYQNYDGTLTDAGKARRKVNNINSSKQGLQTGHLSTGGGASYVDTEFTPEMISMLIEQLAGKSMDEMTDSERKKYLKMVQDTINKLKDLHEDSAMTTVKTQTSTKLGEYVKHSDTPTWKKLASAKSTKYVKHSGVKDMKWGHRRYQNTDGSLTELGRIHYGVGTRRQRAKAERQYIREKESEDKEYVKRLKKINKYNEDQKKAEEKQAKEDERLKEKREAKVEKEIASEKKKSDKEETKALAEKLKAEVKDKQDRKALLELDKLDKEFKDKVNKLDKNDKNYSEKLTKINNEYSEKLSKLSGKQQKADSKKQEAKQEEKPKSEKQMQSQNESKKQAQEEKPQKRGLDSSDYGSVSSAFMKGKGIADTNANFVDQAESYRQKRAVRQAVGERKLTKPISQMTDKEINDTINRYRNEDALAQMTVGQRSAAADNVKFALQAIGTVSATASGIAGIISDIRRIQERR